MMNNESNIEEIIQRIVAKRGYLYPWQQYMSEHDPDFLARYEELWDMIGSRATHIDAKTKQLILVGVVSSRLDDIALKTQIGRAFRMGINADEILETLQVAYLPSGALTLVHGVKILMDVIAEREEKDLISKA
jgi:alkylhydroperoxidase/carboxymuconolactone decarboxylase family protein YurZ